MFSDRQARRVQTKENKLNREEQKEAELESPITQNPNSN